MARPTFELNPGSFTFDNGHVQIVGQIDIGPPPTVESVALTNPHGDVALGITNLVVPSHLFDLLGG